MYISSSDFGPGSDACLLTGLLYRSVVFTAEEKRIYLRKNFCGIVVWIRVWVRIRVRIKITAGGGGCSLVWFGSERRCLR